MEAITVEVLISALSEVLTEYEESQTEIDPQVFDEILERLDFLSNGISAVFNVLALIFAALILFFVFKIFYNWFSGIIRG
jgi:hypothetical protein